MDDIDPLNDIDTTIDGIDIAGIVEFDEDDEDDDPDDSPTHFQNLLIDRDESLAEYQSNTLDEYISLFALLTSPLEKDPLLKKEFHEYARTKHGVDIEFSHFSAKPKLTLVSSKKDDTPGAPEKPEEPPS